MKEVALRKITFAVLAACLIAAPSRAQAQAPPARPATVGKPMPDFTLPSYQGGDVTLSKLRGKTVILVFLRGHVAPGAWCHVDNFQHGSLVDFETKTQFQKKNNAEILMVLPYDKAEVEKWVGRYAQQAADIEKNEKSPYSMPKMLKLTEGTATTFPILLDADRTLTKELGVFSTDWSGSKEEQDVPTTIVIDPDGVVQFKYFSQNTLDRPGVEYLTKIVNWINEQGTNRSAKPEVK
jgi:peroxiredoxin